MSPEQIQGLPLGDTCDLYALGVIAFALLSGKEPFQAETATAVVFKHLHESPPDIREERPNLPNAWVEMLAKLLAKKPEERYQSADELAGVLQKLPV
jgi:serine/threonine-protein kinase